MNFEVVKNILLVVVAICLCACTHKAAIMNLPVPALPQCDTSNLLYKKDIQPIFRGNCYECHSTAVTHNGIGEEGLDLEDTASLKHYLKNGYDGDGQYGSMLYHCILHSPHALQMPPTYKLDSCSMKKIKHWLDTGGPVDN